MKKLTGNQTRALFLEYFKKQGHMVEPSASLIPHDDPTLLWINAGVAALKAGDQLSMTLQGKTQDFVWKTFVQA